MTDQVQCDTVRITVSHTDGTVTFTVPAYTASLSAFITRAYSVLRAYVAGSLEQRQPMSLGDFALHVLTVAATDPKTQQRCMADSTTAIPDDIAAVTAAFRKEDFVPWTDADRAADYGDLLGRPDDEGTDHG